MITRDPSPPTNHRFEWILVVLLSINLGWTTFCLGGVRPDTMVVTSALNALLLIVYFAGRAFGSAGRSHAAGWVFLPFLAYAAANVIWVSPVPWHGWRDWLFWAQMMGVFWVVLNGIRNPRAQAALLGVLFAIAAISVVLACYQRFVKPDWLMLGRTQAAQFLGRSSGPFGIPNSFAALLLLITPAAVALTFRRGANAMQRVLFGWLALLLAFGFVLTISRGAWLAMALALAAHPLFSPGRWWRRLGAGAAMLAVAMLITAGLYAAAPKVRARLDALKHDAGERSRPILWRAAWQIFREHPVAGSGAGTFNIAFERHRPESFQDEPKWAHNDYINTLSDYGVLGFGLFFGAAGSVAWRCLRRSAKEDRDLIMPLLPALGIGLLAFALQLFVDFHFKIPALGMALATVTGIAVQASWPRAASPPRRVIASRIFAGVLATATLTAASAMVLPHYRSDAIRYRHRREIDDLARRPLTREAEYAVLERANHAFRRATEIDARNAQAWSDRAYALALLSRHDIEQTMEYGRQAESHARRAIAEAAPVSEHWIRLGVALDMQRRWVDAGAAFTTALGCAPKLSQSWYYQAYHWSLKPGTAGLARSAVATCLRLDPRNREAEALRQRLAVPR